MKYKQKRDLNEKEVNEILEEGYMLHSITPVYNQQRNSYGGAGDTHLIYHFIWDYNVSFIGPEFNIAEDTLFSDINGNDTLGPLL